MLSKPVRKIVARFRALRDEALAPIPPDSYRVDASFARQVRSSLAVGNVSMGLGRMFSKEDHERLYASLKDYKFTK